MKKPSKVMKQYIRYTVYIALLLVLINIIAGFIGIWNMQNEFLNLEESAKNLAKDLSVTGEEWNLSKAGRKMLDKTFEWGMLLDENGTILWKSNSLPKELNKSYSTSQVAVFSRWYLEEYPITVWEKEDNLLVLGGKQNSIWKIQMNASYFIQKYIVIFAALIMGINMFIAFLIAYFLGKRSVKEIEPIIEGILSLKSKKELKINSKGALDEVAKSLNDISIVLSENEVFRKNWIEGVSHDIRTPLSIILARADEIEASKETSEELQLQAASIKYQSLKIKELVRNLNVESTLTSNETMYEMKKVNLVRLFKDQVINRLNYSMSDKYPIDFSLPNSVAEYVITGNEELLIRMFDNILNNAIYHNPNGCEIKISFENSEDKIRVNISDNGIGMSQKEFELLQTDKQKTSYTNMLGEKHGLGMHIVKQIVDIHKGKIIYKNGKKGGLCVQIFFEFECFMYDY